MFHYFSISLGKPFILTVTRCYIPTAGLASLLVCLLRDPRIKQQRLRRPGQQAAAKLAEDRRIKPRIRQLQAQDVCPIDATPHGMRRLAVRESLRELEDGDQR